MFNLRNSAVFAAVLGLVVAGNVLADEPAKQDVASKEQITPVVQAAEVKSPAATEVKKEVKKLPKKVKKVKKEKAVEGTEHTDATATVANPETAATPVSK